jgi:hypothetical protein
MIETKDDLVTIQLTRKDANIAAVSVALAAAMIGDKSFLLQGPLIMGHLSKTAWLTLIAYMVDKAEQKVTVDELLQAMTREVIAFNINSLTNIGRKIYNSMEKVK